MGVIGGRSSGNLRAPVGAPTTTSISVAGPDVVASTTHVVDNCISIDTDTSSSASLDHVTELLSVTMATIQSVADGLVVEPPGVKFTILRPFIREDTFLRREDLDTHPSHLAKCSALSLYVGIWPAEHFDDGSLLTIFVFRALGDIGGLPDEIEGLKSDVPSKPMNVVTSDSNREGARE